MQRRLSSAAVRALLFVVALLFGVAADVRAQSCGAIGGDYCSQSGSCPAGYDSLGQSDDCHPCCKAQPPAPSCGEMGGDYCSQTSSCPAGFDPLGRSNDCKQCCRQQPSAPSCGAMGGDYCSQASTCPAGYDPLGRSGDCKQCCKQQPPPAPSCGAMGGDYCSQASTCPAGYDPLGRSGDCKQCCKQQPPPAPSCGAMGGDYCSQVSTCPAGYDPLGRSGDCKQCCKQGPSCGAMGGDYCSQTSSCPTGYASLGTSYDCTSCCKSQPPAPSCGAMGGDYCSQSASCPAGFDPLGRSNDCTQCCKQQPQPPSCGAMGGNYCSQTSSCPAGYDPLGKSNDCKQCCSQHSFSVSAGGPYEGARLKEIQFRAAVTTNPGDTVSDYLWEFGDGTTASASAPVHAYVADGLYIVKLTVRLSNGLALTATTTAQIHTVRAEALCRSCITSLFFAYDAGSDSFVGEASISIKAGTTESVDYEPFLRVYVVDPEGILAFDSGFVAGRVQIPTPAALRTPRSGTWIMIADYWYRSRFPGPLPFFEVDLKSQAALVPVNVCDAELAAAAGVSCKVKIKPSNVTLIDGQAVALTGSVVGSAVPTAQRWSFQAPSGTSPDPAPDVTFATPDALASDATPHWFARPDQSCPSLPEQALRNSRYTILLDVTTNEGTARGKAEITVLVPWGLIREYSIVDAAGKLAAAATPQPRLMITYGPAFADGVWRIDLPTLKIERVASGDIQYGKGLTPASRFYDKIVRHEENHRRFIYEPGQPGFAYWNADDLRAVLTRCTNDGSCTAKGTSGTPGVLGPAVSRAFRDWEKQESTRWNNTGQRQTEAAAYGESDAISPRYIYQNCGRY